MKPEVATVPEENSHALSLGRLRFEANPGAYTRGKNRSYRLMVPATSEVLLKKVEELKGTPKKEMARALGFVSKTKTGQERVKLASFMNALLEAKGVGFGGSSERDGRGGHSASYRIQVQQNGNLLVGAAYTREMGLEPGTEFEIHLGRKHIKLVQVSNRENQSSDHDAAMQAFAQINEKYHNVFRELAK
jgi:AbrB-like transcriptional regulator